MLCLKGLNLHCAILNDATLTDAHLENVNLSGAECIRANFRNADLKNANVSAVKFYDADLSHADLTSATGLLPDSLAGAVLTGTKLPSELQFDGLRTAEEMSKNSSKYFMGLMAACAYVILTTMTAF